MHPTKLHLGCGLSTPHGWVNLDGSWNAWLSNYPHVRKLLIYCRMIPEEKASIAWNNNVFIHDVRKKLPFDNNYFSTIYSSHLLEHLYFEEAKYLLRECFRILEPYGILRMVVPDLKTIVTNYLEEINNYGGIETVAAADNFNMKLLLRAPQPPSGNLIYRLYSCVKDYHSHKWMYDAISLIGHLKRAGFHEVSEMKCHQSRIDDIEQIERDKGEFHGAEIYIEGIKPT
jgi:ubiquinone/menaquinone biosynthesis C-methylase UbiE